MKYMMLAMGLLGSMVVSADHLVQGPRSARADDVPEKYRETVKKGLEYLAKKQHADGHWESEDGKYPVTMTALSSIALLMDSGIKGKHAANVCKAAEWLIAVGKKQKTGLIYSGHPSETRCYMNGHGLAVTFLSGLIDCFPHFDDQLPTKCVEVLQPAFEAIRKSQSSDGGWYPTSKTEGHNFATIPATVVQLQALQAADLFPIAHELKEYGHEYLKHALAKYETVKPEHSATRDVDTAAATACRLYLYALPYMRKDSLCAKWMKHCRSSIARGREINVARDELLHYYYAQALYEYGDADTWEAYRNPTFDHLQRSQNGDGSWPACNGLGTGPVYATAIWCIVLQIERRNHPSMVRRENH